MEPRANLRAFAPGKLEKAVAKVNPKAATPEKATYVSEKRLDLRLGVSEELMLKIRRAQDQVSRSKGKPATLEDTFEAAIALYLQHKDPLEKARRVIAKKGSVLHTNSINKPFTGTVPVKAPKAAIQSRLPLRAALAHQIRVRDQNQCQTKSPRGKICGEKRWTDLHHIKPVSQGGTHALDNLITLCRAHHREHHRAGG